MKFEIAKREDTACVLEFIKELAEYEHMLDQVVADEKTLEHWLFDQKKAEVLFVVEDGVRAGFALFFHNFSTFLGKAGIYLEDLYVKPEFRGRGLGAGLIKELACITVERGCGRLEWCCLNWNQPSIDFYLGMGAKAMTDWTQYRVTGERLQELGKR